jgi:hypothetical protein
MINRLMIAAIVIIVVLATQSCKHEVVINEDDAQFCALVNEHNFEATGPIIDRYLATLPSGYADENLQKLNEWFNAKACIENSVILCNSCIETLPPQSELRISFLSNGQTITLTIDILMGEPLTFRAFH